MLGGYALTTYPGPQQFRRNRQAGPFDGSHLLGGLRNAGYAEAKYNVRTMRRVGMRVPMIWVDVEPYAVAPWSLRKTANRAVVSGAIRAYRDSGYRVGIYTYLNGWRAVAGGWRLTQLPTWSTVGHLHSAEALASCTRGPSGGPTWLAQWYSPHRDYDLVCPGAPSSAELFTAAAS
jgi:hypothetical protein